jgi:hypothetical protein
MLATKFPNKKKKQANGHYVVLRSLVSSELVATRFLGKQKKKLGGH